MKGICGTFNIELNDFGPVIPIKDKKGFKK